ncbi:MAG: DUF1289 domain-containing protein [Proteobacteria bacterium]|nr:DUF1289 domain-containing protein [Pseudomonadota bacterium]
MSATAPGSPCIKTCVLDERGFCRGCRRSLAEIASWSSLSAEEQWAIIDQLPAHTPDLTCLEKLT